MANTKISQLTALSNPTGSEEFVYAFNNANGKVTLNTMKTFVQPDLSGYQEALVNQVNIKSINNQSLLGSGNIDISGGGGGSSDTSYDCIVDANGGGDYTTIGAAVNAGNQYIFVKNGTYNETVGRDPYTNSISILHIIGESKKGVQITIPENITTTNGYVIDMRYNDSADFYLENLSFTITLSNTNKVFYVDNGGNSFFVKNCSFNYTTTASTSSTANNLFYSKIIGTNTGFANVPYGFYFCDFSTEVTVILNITYQNMYAYGCYFYSAAGKVRLVQQNNQAILNKCKVNTFGLGGTYGMIILNSDISVADGGDIYSYNYNQLYIYYMDNSKFELGTLANTPDIALAVCLNSNLSFKTYDVACSQTYNGIKGVHNCTITCGGLSSVTNMSGCSISSTSFASSSRGRIIGNVFETTVTSVTCSSTDAIIDGNVFRGTGTFTLSGAYCIITSNNMRSMTLTDTGSDNVKANNVTSS